MNSEDEDIWLTLLGFYQHVWVARGQSAELSAAGKNRVWSMCKVDRKSGSYHHSPRAISLPASAPSQQMNDMLDIKN
jgi:hypothetical protein